MAGASTAPARRQNYLGCPSEQGGELWREAVWWSPAGQSGVGEAASPVQIPQGMVELGFVCWAGFRAVPGALPQADPWGECPRLICGVMG